MGNKLMKYNSGQLHHVRNNLFCSYLIALEGWRRGLKLTFDSSKVTKNNLFAPGLKFTLSSEKNKHTFYKSRGDKVKGDAFKIGSNKYETKRWLKQNGLPVAEGKMFDKDSTKVEYISYANEIGYPVVLKPVVGAKGQGVIPGIQDEESLVESLSYLKEKLPTSKLILEKHYKGEEFRVYVIEDEVIAVINRVPANITGDGKHTIKELINIKNKERKKNPRLYSCLIKIDIEIENKLKRLGLDIDYIPENGNRIFLRDKSNISMGGDSIEVTETFPEEIKIIAINALGTIENFPVGGVDIIYDGSTAIVVELSPTPQIGSLVFPMEGNAIDVPGAIIDYYFPESIVNKNVNNVFYFNMRKVLRALEDRTLDEITITPCPTEEINGVKLIIKGNVQKVGYRRWLRRIANKYDVSGSVINKADGSVEVYLMGEKVFLEKVKSLCWKGPAKASVDNILETDWSGPYTIGFEIKKTEVKIKSNGKSERKNRKNGFLNKIMKKILN